MFICVFNCDEVIKIAQVLLGYNGAVILKLHIAAHRTAVLKMAEDVNLGFTLCKLAVEVAPLAFIPLSAAKSWQLDIRNWCHLVTRGNVEQLILNLLESLERQSTSTSGSTLHLRGLTQSLL